tara:strand:+ start:257 stop:385 length:129 start_codon:yes stop_codon:yes gene_type:complete
MTKMKCRKCGLKEDVMSFDDCKDLQKQKCGAGGTHKIIGVIE